MIAQRHFHFRCRRSAALNFTVHRQGWLHRWILSGRFCLFLLFAIPAGSAEVAALQLQANVQVDSEGIFLQQIASSTEALPVLKLCPAPAFGQTTELTRAQINDLLAKVAPALATTNWMGADSIRVSRRARQFDQMAITELLTRTLQQQYVKDKGDLELTLTQPWSTVTLPDEPTTLRILEIPTTGVTPFFITRFEVCTAHETVGTFEANVQAHIWRDVWVAHSPVKRGSLMGEADVARERRDIVNVHETLATFDEGDETLEFAGTVSAGYPILARDLKPKSVIHRGETADARIDDGALTIKLKVIALEDGAPGQTIKLRNAATSHYLSGKVIDEQTVAISL
jgi:flagella basal body P-ring formation protein FlgA